MDHECRAALVKERILPVAKCRTTHCERRIRLSVLPHLQVFQITEVWMRLLRILDSVVCARWIEVSTGSRNRRRFALPDIVNVNSMFPFF